MPNPAADAAPVEGIIARWRAWWRQHRELEKLPPERKARAAQLLVQAVMYCRDPDGSFWDYPLYGYHKPYGTAFAVITLARARTVLGAR